MSFNVGYIAGGRFDPPFMPTKTEPFIEGRLLEVYGMVTDFTDVWIADRDYELVSIAMESSAFQVRDNWSVKHNDRVICNHIYVKQAPEEVYLMAVITVKAGDRLQFTFNNEGGHSKFVSINYQMLADPGAVAVV